MLEEVLTITEATLGETMRRTPMPARGGSADPPAHLSSVSIALWSLLTKNESQDQESH